ncbi:hypothetical protein VNO78_12692 [Psophocarpus tetragonolobus]|uniref:Uncharacterized protein n=1 Tax=Psophocarpus tetragonolobus TaxID=3891 RepID=A0AAN9SPI0_PSOTE
MMASFCRCNWTKRGDLGQLELTLMTVWFSHCIPIDHPDLASLHAICLCQSKLAKRHGGKEAYEDFFMGMTHFKDIAMTHILALENKKVARRHLCVESISHFSDLVNTVVELYPQYRVAKLRLPKDTQTGLLRASAKDASKKFIDLGLELTPVLSKLYQGCSRGTN